MTNKMSVKLIDRIEKNDSAAQWLHAPCVIVYVALDLICVICSTSGQKLDIYGAVFRDDLKGELSPSKPVH